ncbi:hypothetical protein [Pseudomonas sp. KU43P]|uniref:hypothetical protein n=1 Tax=Pseudomonas sp. KU43P TaxID=2487887 RepID=UPI0012A94BD6|nr:hypothetical protein [Pseudomonas sp. KU43P]BBH46879.1 hypothetical protein KU43P_33560 [Pseudomonas sp. KU43P]
MDIDSTDFEFGVPMQAELLEHQSRILTAKNDELSDGQAPRLEEQETRSPRLFASSEAGRTMQIRLPSR